MRPIALAGLLALFALGALCVVGLLVVAAEEDPSPPLMIEAGSIVPAAAVHPECETPPPAPNRAATPALSAKKPEPGPEAAGEFHGVRGRVLFAGRPATARVELRLLRRGGVGYFAGQRSDGSGPALALERAPFTPPLAVTEADEDGRFRFKRLGPGVWELTAIDREGRAASVTASVNHEDPVHHLTIDMPDGSRVLTGVVRYADGRPFGGPVRLFELDGRRMASYRPAVLPDAEGRFRFDHLGDRPVQVVAWLPDACWACTWPVHLPRAEPLEIVIGASDRKRVGRVIDNVTARPVAGARVWIWSRGGPHQSASFVVRTGRDGRFSMPAVGEPSGGRVECAGYVASHPEFSDSKHEITVRMRRPAVVEGRVTTEAGRPAAGAEILAGLLGSADGNRFHKTRRTVADAEGNYRFDDLPPGPIMVVAWGRAWVSPGIETAVPESFNPFMVDLTAGRVVRNDLAVMPAVKTRGKVVDPEGRPVPGARVCAYEGNYRIRNRSPLIALSDPDGRFVLPVPRAPLTYWVAAAGYGWRRLHADSTGALGEREADGTRVIKLGRRLDAWVTVEIVDEKKRPVPGAKVTWESARDYDVDARVRTGSDGRARLGPLPAAEGRIEVEVTVDAPGHRLLRGAKVKAEAGGDGMCRLQLMPARMLGGRIRWPDGRPAAGIEVSVTHVRKRCARQWGVDYEQRLTTGVDGRFSCRVSLDPHQVEVDFRRDGRRYTAESPEVSGDTVDLKLKAGEPSSSSGGFTLRVLDPEGRPVPRASVVTFRDTSSTPGPAWLRDGLHRLRFHPFDQRRWVMVTGAETEAGRRLGTCVRALPSGADQAFEVRLPEARVIEGAVVDTDGLPVRGCRVVARYERARPPKWDVQDHAVARTDADGHFRLGGLGPHVYTVCVTASSPTDPSPAAIRVPAPATGVRFRLVRGRDVRIRWVSEDGRPLVGLPIHLEDTGGDRRELREVTDVEGRVTFRGVHPLRAHRLHSERAGSAAKRLIRYCCDEWMPEDTTIRLLESCTLKGVVHEAEGGPAAWARVWCHTGTEWIWTCTSSDGTFELEDVPRGMRRLRAAAREGISDWEDAAASEITAPAGATRAELTLPPHRIFAVRLVPQPAKRERVRATLYLPREDGTWGAAYAWARGGSLARFRLPRGLQAREAWLHAQAGGRRTPARAFVGRVDLGPDQVDVAVTPTATARVRVRLGGGDWSDRRASVTLRRGPVELEGWLSDEARAEFQADQVPAGPWEVTATVVKTRRWSFEASPDRRPTTGKVSARDVAGQVVTVPVEIRD